MPEDSAMFQLLAMLLLLPGSVGALADPALRGFAPLPRPIGSGPPAVLLSFVPGKHRYTMNLDFHTADEVAHTTGELRIVQELPKDARDLVFLQLRDSGFAVEK